MDPSIDFGALFKEFDTAVMGRKTYEVLTAQGGNGAMPGLDVVVFSQSLPAAAHRGVCIINDGRSSELRRLRPRLNIDSPASELARSVLPLI